MLWFMMKIAPHVLTVLAMQFLLHLRHPPALRQLQQPPVMFVN